MNRCAGWWEAAGGIWLIVEAVREPRPCPPCLTVGRNMNVSALEIRIGEVLENLSGQQAVSDTLAANNPHLAELFDILKNGERDEPAQAEELIWALWCSHEDREAARALRLATGAMNRGEIDVAGPLLDNLVQTHPLWAEAWNKRATVYFHTGRLDESVDDIRATLALDPRRRARAGVRRRGRGASAARRRVRPELPSPARRRGRSLPWRRSAACRDVGTRRPRRRHHA